VPGEIGGGPMSPADLYLGCREGLIVEVGLIFKRKGVRWKFERSRPAGCAANRQRYSEQK
jgi:hypothetical protein